MPRKGVEPGGTGSLAFWNVFSECTTCYSTTALATEKDAVRSRLGELHRLLNDRKGSLSATYKKNAEANNRAYDRNLKTIQALDTLVEEYGVFEATMKKVTFEHEEEDV